MKRRLAGLLAGLGATLAAVAPANAMTVDEFDTLALEQQGEIVEDTVRRIHTHVTARRPDPAKAACIRKLFVPTRQVKMPRGIDLLITELDELPDEKRGDIDVETLVLDLVNRECPSVGSAQQR